VDYGNFDSVTEFKQMVKNLLFGKILKLIAASGQSSPPFDPSRLAVFRNVKEIKHVPLEGDGALITLRDGFVIKINQNLSDVRKRFTCAHEIAHTFFFDVNASPPRYGYDRLRSNREVEEGLCHEMAREMLMPRFAIMRFVNQRFSRPSMQAYASLAEIFRVSLQALAFRIGDLNVWDAIIASFSVRDSATDVFFELSNFPIKAGRFQHAPHIYKRKHMIRSDSTLGKILVEAYAKGYAAGTCDDFGKIKENFWVEGKYVRGHYPRIVTIWSVGDQTVQTRLTTVASTGPSFSQLSGVAKQRKLTEEWANAISD